MVEEPASVYNTMAAIEQTQDEDNAANQISPDIGYRSRLEEAKEIMTKRNLINSIVEGSVQENEMGRLQDSRLMNESAITIQQQI